MTFDLDILTRELARLPACKGLLVGFSGGLDSVALLYGLVQLRAQQRLVPALRAIHINHGLHPEAADWERRCHAQCAAWGVEYASAAVKLSSTTGAGLENAAREARYTLFASVLRPDEVLLLAHHRDDQMETLLLRLLRGAGPRGMAGIPRQRPVGNGLLARPLLDIDRRALELWAREQGLEWIDDSANADTHFDRNYLRHEILPRLEARWPGYRESWSKSAALAAEADSVLQELAQSDLQLVQGELANELQVPALRELGKARQRNVLRYWFATLQLPEPGWQLLHSVTDELLESASGNHSRKQAHGIEVARFADRLVLRVPLPAFDPHAQIQWNPIATSSCELPANGRLIVRPSSGSASDRRLAVSLAGPVQIRYRDGGETVRLRDRPRKSLKKLLQEARIEPWWRERLPLLYCNDALLCIPGVGATGVGAEVVIEWQRPAGPGPQD
jgi:tRNA(Ile)-lysidine synthase